jgi:hypothetical protein
LGIALIVAIGAGWWLYQKARTLPSKVVLGGTRVSNDVLGVSSGNLVVITPKPGMYFGTVTKTGGQRQFTYLVLFRYSPHAFGGLAKRIHSHSQAAGNMATTSDAIEMEGRRIEVAYLIELNDAQTEVASETLKINGEQVELSAGHVFLIDLTAATPTIRQKKLELPPIPAKLETVEEIEQFAETIRASLEKQDAEIGECLK